MSLTSFKQFRVLHERYTTSIYHQKRLNPGAKIEFFLKTDLTLKNYHVQNKQDLQMITIFVTYLISNKETGKQTWKIWYTNIPTGKKGPYVNIRFLLCTCVRITSQVLFGRSWATTDISTKHQTKCRQQSNDSKVADTEICSRMRVFQQFCF